MPINMVRWKFILAIQGTLTNRKRFLLLATVLFWGTLLGAISIVASATAGDIDAAKKELAPTGKLRVGLVSAPKANVFFVTVDASGAPQGVTANLGDKLAGALAVATEFVVAHNSGEITNLLEEGSIDVAFLPVDEERRKRVDFGASLCRVREYVSGARHFGFQNGERSRSSWSASGRRG
jgi:hypothetical protein